MRGLSLLLILLLFACSGIAQPDDTPVPVATADMERGYLDMPDAFGNPAQPGAIWHLILTPEATDLSPPSLDPETFGMPTGGNILLAQGRIGGGDFLPDDSRGVGFLLTHNQFDLNQGISLRVFGSDTLFEGVHYIDSGLAMVATLHRNFMEPIMLRTFSAGHGGFLYRAVSEADTGYHQSIWPNMDPNRNEWDSWILPERVSVTFEVQQGGLGLRSAVAGGCKLPLEGWTSDFPPLERNIYVITDQVRAPGEGRTITMNMRYTTEELDSMYHGAVREEDMGIFRQTAEGWELLPATYSNGSGLTYTTTDPAPFFGRFTLAPRWALGTDEETELLPLAFKLHPVYPSPFNPEARIRLDLPGTLPVRLEVFDILGRQVTTLQDGVLPGGSHAFTFSGGHLASGTYFLRVRAGDHHAVQKMVLIR